MSKTPTSQLGVHTAPKPGPAPLALGTPACTRTHRHPTLPHMPIYLPKEKAGGLWAGQGLPLLPTPRRRGKPWAPSRPHN